MVRFACLPISYCLVFFTACNSSHRPCQKFLVQPCCHQYHSCWFHNASPLCSPRRGRSPPRLPRRDAGVCSTILRPCMWHPLWSSSRQLSRKNQKIFCHNCLLRKSIQRRSHSHGHSLPHPLCIGQSNRSHLPCTAEPDPSRICLLIFKRRI